MNNERRRHVREVTSVSRKSICMLELQLRTRLWLESDLLAEAEKRAIIALVRKGIHTVDIETLDEIIAALKQEGMRLRVEVQRPQMRTRLHDAGPVSWDHYHVWEVLRDIDVWEHLHPNHLQLVDDDPEGDEEPEDFVDLDPPKAEAKPVPKKPGAHPDTERSVYVAITQKLADALYWIAEFTTNGGITSAALAVQLGDISQSGASTRIKKLMEKGLVTWAPGTKETYIVSDFWYDAEVVVA